MSLEHIFYTLGIVSFAFFITANLFVVAIFLKAYFFAKQQAKLIEDRSQKITNLIDIITSRKTKTLVTLLSTIVFVFRIIKKTKRV